MFRSILCFTLGALVLLAATSCLLDYSEYDFEADPASSAQVGDAGAPATQ